MITLTKADALARQAAQVAYYAAQRSLPELASAVAAVTTADHLPDGEHPVHIINRHIPRGCAIERIVHDLLEARGSEANCASLSS